MCFSIPLKVLKIDKRKATIEGGIIVRLDNSLKVKNGDYVRLAGNIIVDKISKQNGLKIRKLIKKLNS